MAKFLIGDVGGTNTRLALVRTGERTWRDLRHYRNRNFVDLDDIVTRYLAETVLAHDAPSGRAQIGAAGPAADPIVDGAVFALAGPVDGPTVDLTNIGWRVDETTLSSTLGGAPVRLANDFAVLARALPNLTADDLVPVNRGVRRDDGVRCVIGPGTGFGAAALVRTAGGAWLPLASEGGHMPLVVAGAEERRLLAELERRHGPISVEKAVSGPGLMRIYQALAALDGAPTTYEMPADLTWAALQRSDALATATLRQFVVWLARAASVFALTFLPRGGLFIGGGIAPQITSWLTGDPFLPAYTGSSGHAALLASIPVSVITADHAGLIGAAVMAQAVADEHRR